MLKFDNSNIFTGYIKQLLADFNLPNYRVYTKEHRQYLQQNGEERPDIFETVKDKTVKYKQHFQHFSYIKNNGIYRYVYTENLDATYNNEVYKWGQANSYYPGQKILNNTKNLKIKNNIYDIYTHEYLGEYLRFQRDYNNLDLMPLYNCFSNKVCNNLVITTYDANNKELFRFDSDDTNYKIYMLPVKLYKNYTIAIDSDMPVEVCCGLFNKYYYESLEYLDFVADTYKKFTQLKFNQPILYTNLIDIFSKSGAVRENLLDIAKHETDLKLFIKLPANAKSSIVVLEGNYIGYNDKLVSDVITKETTSYQNKQKIYLQNHTVTNFENSAKDGLVTIEEFSDRPNFKPITPLELLSINTGTSYPFANKLIEYLVGNVITGIDETTDNVVRVQKVISDYTDGYVDGLRGIWDPRIQPVIYDYINNKFAKSTINHDVFGYIDKSAETNVCAIDFNTGKTNSIANVDIYEDLYLALKEQ